MKKLLAIILAVAMVMSMAVVTSADPVSTNEIVVFDKPEGDNLGGVGAWYGVGYTDGYGNLGETRAFLEGVIELSEIKELFSRGGTKFEYTFGASYIDYDSKGGPSANINFGIDVYTLVAITDLGDGMYKGVVELDELLAAWEAAGYTVDSPQFVGFVIQVWCGDFVLYNAKFITAEEAPEAPEAIDVTLYENEEGNTFTADATTYLDPWGGFGICSEVNGQNVGNISLAELVTYAEMEGSELVITFEGGGFWGGSKPETEVQFNCWDTEEDLQVKFDITTMPGGVNKGVVKFETLISKLEALGLTTADIRNLGVQVWASNFKLHTVAIHVPAPEVPETTIIEVTETVEATYSGTFGAEGDWGTDQTIDFNTVSAGIKKSESWINFNANVIDIITSIAPLADIESVTLTTVADTYESWERETAGRESIGMTKVMGVAYGLNTDWSPQFTSYNMQNNNSWSFTKADIEALADPLTKVNVKVFNGKPNSTVNFTISIEVTYNKEVVAEEEEVLRGSGYFMTGDETHAMIIGKAIITSNHVFDEDGDCKYCGHHVDVEVEDIIVEQPTESTEEESEDITVEEPKEDTNPGTGLTLAVIPMIVALAAVVISKR